MMALVTEHRFNPNDRLSNPDISHRIGPNAITQILNAADELGLTAQVRQIFVNAGLEEYLLHPPTVMVDERTVAKLHNAIRLNLLQVDARRVLRSAGERTGLYIIAHRIPRSAKSLLRILPKHFAARLLTKAIAMHAWTFAGSGNLLIINNKTIRITMIDNPLCPDHATDFPDCVWHEAVFATLYRTLISSNAKIYEIECRASGNSACVFEITL